MLKLCITLLFSVFLAEFALGQILFPEKFEVDNKRINIHGRVPLFSPSRCGANELLYPGDQKNDWICDCAPATVYHPDTNTCYPLHRQGPCPEEQILAMPDDKIIPECVANPCKTDNMVEYEGKCYKFGRSGPCRNAELSYVLGVDANTLKVDCVRISIALVTRVGGIPTPPPVGQSFVDLCARGSKRLIAGRCPPDEDDEDDSQEATTVKTP